MFSACVSRKRGFPETFEIAIEGDFGVEEAEGEVIPRSLATLDLVGNASIEDEEISLVQNDRMDLHHVEIEDALTTEGHTGDEILSIRVAFLIVCMAAKTSRGLVLHGVGDVEGK